MIAILVVCTVSFGISLLTLFSGFGLGTVLMPVFALFFPLPVAIAATAIVHMANNIFKLFLVGKNADWGVVARFAIPGAIAAVCGALLLTALGALPPLYRYTLGGRVFEVTAMKAAISVLIVTFSVLELMPWFCKLEFAPKYLSLGGLLSGFFGGLSGHQGALRSAFLIRAGLRKEAFVGTGVIAAVIVDISRLLVYGTTYLTGHFSQIRGSVANLVVLATLAAFLGAFIGKKLLRKMTISVIQKIVAASLVMLGIAFGAGLV